MERNDKEKILEIENVTKYYGSGAVVTKALDGISFDVEKGEFTAIMGASGSGKSTLLNVISTIDRVSCGEIRVEGRRLTGMRENDLSAFRRDRLGFIFQEYNLLDTLTIGENIVLPLRLDGKQEDKAFLEEIVRFLELDGKLANYPSHLSGGRRAAPAGGLRPGPHCEPGIDSRGRAHGSPGLGKRQEPDGDLSDDEPFPGLHHPDGHPRRPHGLLCGQGAVFKGREDMERNPQGRQGQTGDVSGNLVRVRGAGR